MDTLISVRRPFVVLANYAFAGSLSWDAVGSRRSAHGGRVLTNGANGLCIEQANLHAQLVANTWQQKAAHANAH